MLKVLAALFYFGMRLPLETLRLPLSFQTTWLVVKQHRAPKQLDGKPRVRHVLRTGYTLGDRKIEKRLQGIEKRPLRLRRRARFQKAQQDSKAKYLLQSPLIADPPDPKVF